LVLTAVRKLMVRTTFCGTWGKKPGRYEIE
jgi:hypothetical protein